MNVVFISPGYPAEMAYFVRGLAGSGACVLGVGDQPPQDIVEPARSNLWRYLRVDSLWDEATVLDEVATWLGTAEVDRVECLWEPGMLLAARLRERLGAPGMDVAQTLLFRDKERMKQAVEAVGLRTPRHARASSVAQVREAADRIGFPLVVKPIAGAGAADTHRADDPRELEQVLRLTGHVPEIGVEEYIEGEEHSFDTICTGGEVRYSSMSWYRPRLLIARRQHWLSPQTVTLRDPHALGLAGGETLGLRVLEALGFETGFTHMEWFLDATGDAVFLEIAARPPGARMVELMNYASDIDVFAGWAEAVCHGRFGQQVTRKYNAAAIFKRADGPPDGRIARIEGLGGLMARYRTHVAHVELLPIGATRRDWQRTFLGDGYVVVRHPELRATLEMADRVGTELRLEAE
jgi:biotin carboxylase